MLARDRSQRPPPKTTANGTAFVTPPWDAPLDVEGSIAMVPSDASVAGMYFLAITAGAKARGLVFPVARNRYVPFSFYSMADFARLLVDAAKGFFPDRSVRRGLRALGTLGPEAFSSSVVGKVTLGAAESVAASVAAIGSSAYNHSVRPSKCDVVEAGADWMVMHLEVSYFLDSHHVGMFEGVLRKCGVKGSVLIASYSETSADLLVSWGQQRR